jgi:hypothetical protein
MNPSWRLSWHTRHARAREDQRAGEAELVARREHEVERHVLVALEAVPLRAVRAAQPPVLMQQ